LHRVNRKRANGIDAQLIELRACHGWSNLRRTHGFLLANTLIFYFTSRPLLLRRHRSLLPSRSGAPPGAACTSLRLAQSGSGPTPLADHFRLECRHLAQAAEMARGLAEPGRQKRLNEVPSQQRPHGPGSHTDDIHVVILDTLPG